MDLNKKQSEWCVLPIDMCNNIEIYIINVVHVWNSLFVLKQTYHLKT